MLYLKLCVAASLLVIFNGCTPKIQNGTETAAELHPEAEPIGEFGDKKTLEDIFLKLHLIITQKMSVRKDRTLKESVTFEIISIVNTAEEFYLQGDTIEAIELLNEAEELLEQNN